MITEFTVIHELFYCNLVNNIQKRFKKHILVKRKSWEVFNNRIDDAMVYILSIEDHQKYSSRYTKLRRDLLKEIFFFEFNFQLLVYLGDKHQSMKRKINNTRESVLRQEQEFEFYSSSDSGVEEEGPPTKSAGKGNKYRAKRLEKVLKFKKMKDSLTSRAMYVLYDRIQDNLYKKTYDDYLKSDQNKKIENLYSQESGYLEDSSNPMSAKKGKQNKNKLKKKRRKRNSIKRSSIYYVRKQKEKEIEMARLKEEKEREEMELEENLKDKKFSKFIMEKIKIEASNKFEIDFDERKARYVIMTILDYFFPVYSKEED